MLDKVEGCLNSITKLAIAVSALPLDICLAVLIDFSFIGLYINPNGSNISLKKANNSQSNLLSIVASFGATFEAFFISCAIFFNLFLYSSDLIIAM